MSALPKKSTHTEKENEKINKNRMRYPWTSINNKKRTRKLTRDASEVSETLNHSGGTGNHGGDKPGNVQENGDSNHDPVLDGVAPPDVTLPERDLLVDRSRRGDLGNAVLELAFSAVVMAPDRSNMTQNRRGNACTEDIVVALAIEIVGLDLPDPGEVVITSTVGNGDECADDDEEVEGAHEARDSERDRHGGR